MKIMPTPRPIHLTAHQMACELYARGIFAERDYCETLAETQPDEAWGKLRKYHDLDTADTDEWGRPDLDGEAA